ncbi:VOC family protein [Rhizobium paknamense]|uniref:Catechol 2,3-dioxygenase-like lactoylglutathione lyase family enzyme n=1 Tax=Rhizobium paknamense TaxID=1206817 RepID=A0ABU0I9Q4_9HYPH|nr:VOC family protein [Rhizobium paknamense]MDQ0454960.1 catechol 2,3-dioxygenase-like lactoylglutathione lyase family enzyme [Rhizobium paknamense]
MALLGFHHVQLAMPAGEEARARAFYSAVLGLSEVEKPADLAGRGGCWFESGSLRVHLGVEADFRPARKAHPAFLVDDLARLERRVREGGYETATDVPLAGFTRLHVFDPFGNRIELIQAM